MADPVTTAVVGEIVKKLVDQISRQFSYLFSYTSNIRNLQDGVKDLKDTKDGVKKMVEAGERNSEEVGEAGKTWLDKVEEKDKMAQEILEGTKMVNDGCMKGWCPNLKQRYSLSRKAVKQIVVIKKLKEDGEMFKSRISTLFDPKLPSGLMASSSTTQLEEFETRILMTNKVIDALKNESISKVGICGLGGIGKTRMATEIRERAVPENFFDEVAMAEVSQIPDSKKIQDQLAVMLGLKLEEKESVRDRGKKLRERLTQDRRILVILDDLWDELDLLELGIHVRSQGEANGCKLLITSRWKRVCVKMEIQVFTVQLLSEEEAWDLFKEKAGDCVETSEFRLVAKDVLKECGRLPLAIITVGSALKGCEICEWKDALHQLQGCTSEEIIEKVYASLRLSYDYLDRRESSMKKKEGNQLQQLFLICCIFPEDANIPVEDLVRFSVGLRFLNDVEDLESARNRVWSFVNRLKSCHLLEHSDKKGCVKMHDIVRDFGLFVASNGGEHVHMVKHDAKLKQWPESDAINPTAISIRSKENLELPHGLDYPSLRLLLISAYGSIDVSIDYFRGMKELRVLVINGEWVSFDSGTMAKAPELLMNVRTLCLERCRFSTDIGLIGSLCNLEILSFWSTKEIDVLPKEIGQLKKLKLLDLRDCEVGLVESGVLSSLTKLEELYMGDYFNKEGVEELNNGNCARVTELYSLSCLRRLQLCVSEPGLIMMLDFPGEELTRFHFSMSSYYWGWDYDFANEVNLNSVDLGKLSGSMFEGLMRRAEVVSLSSVSGWKNIMRESDIDGYLNLRKLVIEENDVLVEICDGNVPVGSMGKLEELRLSSLSAMMYIWRGRVRPPCLNNLEVFEIEKCNAIQSLFSPSVVRCLLQLEVLEISYCELLEEIISEDVVEEDENANIITLPNLKHVKLESLPSLGSHNGSIFSKVLLPSMETLTLRSIGGAVKVLNHEQMYSCFKFQRLEVSDCNEMEVLFDLEGVEEIPDGQVGEKVMVLAQLDAIKIVCLKELREIWKNVPKQRFQGFNNLTKLDVCECPNLRYLFSPCMAKLLVNLQRLEVNDCNEMEVLFDLEGVEKIPDGQVGEKVMVLAQLDAIKIVCLKELREIWKNVPKQRFQGFNNLTKLDVCECPNLRYLFSPCMAKLLVNLQRLEVNDCNEMEVLFDLEGVEEIPDGQVGEKVMVLAQLDAIKIVCLKELREIWKNVPKQRFQGFNNLTKLDVCECPNLRYLFSPCMAKLLVNLQRLEVNDCNEMEVLFDLEGVEEIPDGQVGEKVMVLAQLDAIKIVCLKELREIWKNVPKQGFQGFHNLTKLDVVGCNKLRYLMSISMAKLLVNLQVINVASCKLMEYVIMIEEEKESSQPQCEIERTDKIVFPNLFQVNLHYLKNLKAFCKGSCHLEFPSLKKVFINNCPNMKILCSESPTPNFEVLLPRMEELTLSCIAGAVKVLNHEQMYSCFNLQKLQVSDCNEMEVLFDLEGVEEIPDGQVGEKIMVLAQLDTIRIQSLYELREIWNNVPKQGFQGFHINLTVLDVSYCDKLRYLMSPCMAKLLVNLQVIEVLHCAYMEEVIQRDDEEEEKGSCGIEMNTILFPHLREIHLNGLWKLKAFHEGSCNFGFPLLNQLVIINCINMNKFCSSSVSQPKLQHVQFGYSSSVPLMVDLNTTIQKTIKRQGESSRIEDESDESDKSVSSEE